MKTITIEGKEYLISDILKKVNPIKKFKLTLTEDEMLTLKRILVKIGGNPEGPRAHANSTLDKINDLLGITDYFEKTTSSHIKDNWELKHQSSDNLFFVPKEII